MSNKRRIVLTDDDELTAKFAIRLLTRHNDYEVEWAKNGQEGLAAVRRAEPYVIITDNEMPVMDGYDFARTLRVSGLYKGPIGLYSGNFRAYEMNILTWKNM